MQNWLVGSQSKAAASKETVVIELDAHDVCLPKGLYTPRATCHPPGADM